MMAIEISLAGDSYRGAVSFWSGVCGICDSDGQVR